MREVTIRLYKIDELSPEIQKRAAFLHCRKHGRQDINTIENFRRWDCEFTANGVKVDPLDYLKFDLKDEKNSPEN